MENIIYQHRWYDESWTSWEPWKDCTEERYREMIEYIQDGYRYQVRVLTEQSRQGYMIPAPSFDQEEFDTLVIKGTIAWANVNIEEIRDNDGC